MSLPTDLRRGARARHLAGWLHRVALGAYPSAFRREFGPELQEIFDARLMSTRGGAPSRACLAAYFLADAVTSGMTERLRVLARSPRSLFMTRESVLADLRLALRESRRAPLLATVVVLTLALGIGANAAIFSVVYAVLLRPLPYADPSRLVMIWSDNRRQQEPANPVSPANFSAFRQETTAFTNLEAMYSFLVPLQVGIAGDFEAVQAATLTPGMFKLLGRDALIGRPFAPGDDPSVVVLSASYWRRRFGGDPAIVGWTLRLQGVPTSTGSIGADQPVTILGVMPDDFAFPYRSMLGPTGFTQALEPDVWVPVNTHDGRWLDAAGQPNRVVHYLGVVGRLKTMATLDLARQELDAVGAGRAQTLPDTNRDWGVTVRPLHDQTVGKVRPALLLLAGGVGLVLLMACVNVANVLLARAAGRAQGLAIRAALGASRRRLVQQALVESTALAVMGGVAGTGVLALITRTLVAFSPRDLPRISETGTGPVVMAFALGLSVVAGLLVGALPAWTAARSRAGDSLHESARATTSRARHQIRATLIVAEVTMAVALAIGAGLLLRSFAAVLHVDPGFDADHLLTFQMNAPARLQTPPARLAYYDDLEARLRALPGVLNVGATTRLPLGSTNVSTMLGVEGRALAPAEMPEVEFRRAGFDYFATMRIPVLRGRAFGPEDAPGALPVVVINEALATVVFPGENPIGRRVSSGGAPNATWLTIVGVVGSVHHGSLEEVPKPELYLYFRQNPPVSPFVVMRTAGNPASLASAAREVVRATGATAPLSVRTMAEIRDAAVAERRFVMMLVTFFGGLALVLAGLGVYGVIALVVAEQRVEIGLRLALGATPMGVARVVVLRAVGLAAAGVVAGLAAGLALSPWLAAQVFGVTATDPLTYVLVAAVLLLVAVAGAIAPAMRAMRTEPAIALRG